MKIKELPSTYYDKYISDMEKSEYKYEDLYVAACNMLVDNNIKINETIVDLGCGIGSFIKYLKEFGYRNYIGIDFSEKAIKRAKERYPEYNFICGNLLNNKEIQEKINENKCFVSFEVLEHIENDIKVIKLLPPKSLFIFSVPNITGHGHVRNFNNHDEVFNRYNKYLEFTKQKYTITKYGKPHHKMFLSKTYRKEKTTKEN